ncbi:hypothetical protein ACP70R_048087 [Stipagrostis hirtigluma subsp. patula]
MENSLGIAMGIAIVVVSLAVFKGKNLRYLSLDSAMWDMNRGRGCGGGRRGRGRGAGRGESEPKVEVPPAGQDNQPNADMVAVLVEMQALRVEMNAMRQIGVAGGDPVGGGGVPPAGGGAVEGGGAAQPAAASSRPLDLREWCGMALERFSGTGAPIEVADWLSAMIEKLDAFQVLATEWVRYATQLLKGEALVWWRNLLLSHHAAYGPMTWPDFVGQFESRFYPVAFMDKMKTQLERCHQGKKTVAEYEIAFNQIVRFVPHVAHNEYEIARIFMVVYGHPQQRFEP